MFFQGCTRPLSVLTISDKVQNILTKPLCYLQKQTLDINQKKKKKRIKNTVSLHVGIFVIWYEHHTFLKTHQHYISDVVSITAATFTFKHKMLAILVSVTLAAEVNFKNSCVNRDLTTRHPGWQASYIFGIGRVWVIITSDWKS